MLGLGVRWGSKTEDDHAMRYQTKSNGTNERKERARLAFDPSTPSPRRCLYTLLLPLYPPDILTLPLHLCPNGLPPSLPSLPHLPSLQCIHDPLLLPSRIGIIIDDPKARFAIPVLL